MASSAKHPRCKACEKNIFSFNDELAVDGAVYHRSCFKCKKCQKPLMQQQDDYSFLEGSPYCKPHFRQITNKNPDAPAVTSPNKPSTPPITSMNELSTPPQPPKLQKAAVKAISFKFGTQDKCVTCNKTVYALEKVSVEGASYHKACFKCLQGGCSISPSNYAAMEGRLYCKHHFKQLFKEKGNYSQLLIKLPSARLAPTSSPDPNDGGINPALASDPTSFNDK